MGNILKDFSVDYGSIDENAWKKMFGFNTKKLMDY